VDWKTERRSVRPGNRSGAARGALPEKGKGRTLSPTSEKELS